MSERIEYLENKTVVKIKQYRVPSLQHLAYYVK